MRSQRSYSEYLSYFHGKATVQYLGPTKGHGIIAMQHIPKGSLIVTSEPPLAAVSIQLPEQPQCTYCFSTTKTSSSACACGLAYCSNECLSRHRPSHALLCTATIDSDDHPLVQFKLHALQTNYSLFYLAAECVAKEIVSQSLTNSSLFNNFDLMAWEKAVGCPVNEDPEEFKQILQDLVSESRDLLKLGLLSTVPLTNRTFLIEQALELYSSLCGMFERNQFEVRFTENKRGSLAGEDEHDAEAKNTPRGTAIYTLCCAANHDCEANAEICFVNGNNFANLRALRDIDVGKEITLSYLQTDDYPLEERQRILRDDYGFDCKCFRCETEDRWTAIQKDLRTRVVEKCDQESVLGGELLLVGGFDISFPTNDKDLSVACLCVLEFPALNVVYELCEEVRITEPYIPGFLAFREAEVCRQMLAKVPKQFQPNVLLLDGCGVLHPRGCGLASHVGVVCDIPTIGVSKKFLAVDGLTRQDQKKKAKEILAKGEDCWELVGMQTGKVYGCGFIPPSATNAIFVSVGHRLDLASAMRIVRVACSKTRVPAPVRHADLLSRSQIRNKKQKV